MSRDLNDWPGAEGCPLERWRARFVIWTLAALAAGSFGVVGYVTWGQ